MILQNLLPINKRTQENFENHFKAADLQPIVDYQVRTLQVAVSVSRSPEKESEAENQEAAAKACKDTGP